MAYSSLSDVTFGDVVGVIFPTNSIISCLYSSIVCAIFLSFSSALISLASTLSRIVWNNSSSLCSSISVHCFASTCSNLTSVRTVSSTSLASLVVYRSIASVCALDCTSCATLICSLYKAFVGILSNTNSNYSTSLSCVYATYLSTRSMSLVMLKVSLAATVIYTVVPSLCIVCYCVVSSLCALVMRIFSKMCLTSVSSCIILSLYFSASSYSSAMRYCTLFATSSASSSVIVYSRASLCAFIFLHGPPIRTISLFCGLDYVGCVVPGVSGMSLPTYPSCAWMLSFLCVEALIIVA
jgi:hypothetical protein